MRNLVACRRLRTCLFSTTIRNRRKADKEKLRYRLCGILGWPTASRSNSFLRAGNICTEKQTIVTQVSVCIWRSEAARRSFVGINTTPPSTSRSARRLKEHHYLLPTKPISSHPSVRRPYPSSQPYALSRRRRAEQKGKRATTPPCPFALYALSPNFL